MESGAEEHAPPLALKGQGGHPHRRPKGEEKGQGDGDSPQDAATLYQCPAKGRRGEPADKQRPIAGPCQARPCQTARQNADDPTFLSGRHGTSPFQSSNASLIFLTYRRET